VFRNPVTDVIVVLVVVLLIFGPKRLPELGKSLGSGFREFKDSITGSGSDDEPSEPQQITQGAPGTAVPTATEPRAADAAPSEHRS